MIRDILNFIRDLLGADEPFCLDEERRNAREIEDYEHEVWAGPWHGSDGRVRSSDEIRKWGAMSPEQYRREHQQEMPDPGLAWPLPAFTSDNIGITDPSHPMSFSIPSKIARSGH